MTGLESALERCRAWMADDREVRCDVRFAGVTAFVEGRFFRIDPEHVEVRATNTRWGVAFDPTFATDFSTDERMAALPTRDDEPRQAVMFWHRNDYVVISRRILGATT